LRKEYSAGTEVPTECGERIDGTNGGDDLDEDLIGSAEGVGAADWTSTCCNV
jgi:hypothetical protein